MPSGVESIWAVGLSAVLLLGFVASNLAHSRWQNFTISRKLPHLCAGIVILPFPWVFKGIFYPILLPGLFLLLLLATHRSEIFHGFAMRGRWSELWFPLGVLISMAASWTIDPWVGVASCLFLSWGDGITGLVRFAHHRGQAKFAKYWCGTWACLAVCLIIGSLLIKPFWVGIIAAVVATGLERWDRVDDNITMPLGALAISLPIVALL